MLIRAYSDLHGNLPVIDPCDVLLIAGDLCPIEDWPHDVAEQEAWLRGAFTDWLKALDAGRIVLTAGNHDFAIEARPERPELPADLLIDRSIEIDGLKIHGAPWIPTLPDWAFHAEPDELRQKAEAMPDDAQLWMEHCPPYGILDKLWKSGKHVGNPQIIKAIEQKRPQWFVCGHIHEEAGFATIGDTQIANIAFVNEFYEPQFRHLALRFEDGQLIRSEADETNTHELFN